MESKGIRLKKRGCIVMYTYEIKEIVKVIDGDTVDAVIDLGFKVSIKLRIRFFGINTPETRLQRKIKDPTERRKEKQRGLKVKEIVKTLLYSSKKIKLESKGLGKYGRVLGVIYLDDQETSLNQYLLDNGHAEEM